MKVREIMTQNPVSVPENTSLAECAKKMRDNDIGAVLVTDGRGSRAPVGIVTDRDLVIRGIAQNVDPNNTTVGTICTRHPFEIDADTDVDEAVNQMRQHKVRRLPVVENGRVVGVVSLGDLAVNRDRQSVLGQISAAPPNH